MSTSAPTAIARTAAMSPLFVIGLLALLLGIQPLTTDLYLPAMPLLAQQLGASISQTQTTFYALVLAFGCSQLVWGPASDRWGRRPILLTGIALYVVAAIGCLLAPHMDALIVFRTVQGAAMGAVVMSARAIVRDLYDPVEGAHAMSKALSGLGIVACCSPLLGSWLTAHLGWRSTMGTLAVVGMLTWVLVWLRFQESLQRANPLALQPAKLLSTWRASVRNRTFLAYTATTTSSYCSLVVLLTSAPFIFSQVLGWSTAQVGALLAANGVFYIAGTMLCRQLIARWGVRKAVALAGSLAALCAMLLLTLAWRDVQHGLAYAGVCLLFSIAHGIQQPCGQSGAVSGFPQAAGMASALNGFTMALLAFATGQLLSQSFNGTVYPLVFGLSFWCFAAALASWTLVRHHGAPIAP